MTVREVVEAPAAVPYRYGLFAVVDPRTSTDPHWRGGVVWESDACAEVGVTEYPCLDAEPVDPLDPDLACYLSGFDPFTVYAFPHRSLVGNQADPRDRAEARLLAGEQHAVEAELWSRLDAVTTPTDVSAVGGLDYALGFVEQALTDAYGSRGVIHVNRLVGSMLYTAGALKQEGATLTTGIGTPVIVGGGYAAPSSPSGVVTIIGSGPVVVYRGQVTTVLGYDRDTNTSTPIAQRDYLVGWDCGTVGAETTIPAPVPVEV